MLTVVHAAICLLCPRGVPLSLAGSFIRAQLLARWKAQSYTSVLLPCFPSHTRLGARHGQRGSDLLRRWGTPSFSNGSRQLNGAHHHEPWKNNPEKVLSILVWQRGTIIIHKIKNIVFMLGQITIIHKIKPSKLLGVHEALAAIILDSESSFLSFAWPRASRWAWGCTCACNSPLCSARRHSWAFFIAWGTVISHEQRPFNHNPCDFVNQRSFEQ